jgi:hypothetical protein
MVRACSSQGKRNTYKIPVAKPERNSSLERPRNRHQDTVKVDLKKIRRGIGNGFIQFILRKWRALVKVSESVVA